MALTAGTIRDHSGGCDVLQGSGSAKGVRPMHSLTWVRILNFRSCVDASFDLASFTALVGCNNAGKSNVLTAIRWLLRPYNLLEKDFNDPARQVSVEGVITGISEAVLDGLDERHRAKIEPYCTDESLRIQVVQSAPGVGKKGIETRVREHGDEEEESGEWKKAPTGIPEALYALFPEPIEIGAMEDAAEDAAKFKTSTTIGRLIAGIVDPIQEAYGDSMRHELSGLRAKLDADGEDRPVQLLEFDEEANEALASFFPDVSIRLHIPTPELGELFRTGTIKAYEEDGVGRDIACLGHGAQRAVQMALVQCLSQRSSQGIPASRRLLIVEEPELYMHPHGIEQVRAALKRLAAGSYQVLVATHSPLVIGPEDVPDTLLVRKNEGTGTEARKTLRSAVESALADYPHQAQVLLSLSNSSKLLFADGVVLAEGKTEQRLIPALFEKHHGITLGLAKIALINQGGVDNTGKSMTVLAALDVPCKAVTDLDYAFRGAIRDGSIEEDDPDIAACKSRFITLASSQGFDLGTDGLPMRGGALTTPEAFAELAKDPAATAHIRSLHLKLRESGVWIWQQGCMDHHVGLAAKTETAWADLLAELDDGAFAALPDSQGVAEMLEWIRKA